MFTWSIINRFDEGGFREKFTTDSPIKTITGAVYDLNDYYQFSTCLNACHVD